MSDLPHLDDFAPHVGTDFHAQTEPATALRLETAEDGSNVALEQFSLVFSGMPDPWLQQGTYALEHAALGRIELFLAPLGPRDGRMQYQSAFARLRDK